MILLQTDDASDPHQDIDNDEVLSDVPTIRVPNNDDRASDQNKNNASVCL